MTKLAEERPKTSEQVLRRRMRIAEIFLSVPDDGMYAEVLDVVLETMESNYGVFGYLGSLSHLGCRQRLSLVKRRPLLSQLGQEISHREVGLWGIGH